MYVKTSQIPDEYRHDIVRIIQYVSLKRKDKIFYRVESSGILSMTELDISFGIMRAIGVFHLYWSYYLANKMICDAG